MNSLDYALHWVDDRRASCPLLLGCVSSAALSILQTEPGALELLSAVQLRAQRQHPPPMPEISLFPLKEEEWEHSERMGRRIAKRHDTLYRYGVRSILRQSLLRENRRRRAVTRSKPYDVFAVWYLFVESREWTVRDKAYISSIGKMAMEATVAAESDVQAGADTAAFSVMEAIRDLDESGLSDGE